MIRAHISTETFMLCVPALMGGRLMWCGRMVTGWQPAPNGAVLESECCDGVERTLAGVLSEGWQRAVDARAAAGVH